VQPVPGRENKPLVGEETSMFVLIGWSWMHDFFKPITELGKHKSKKAIADFFWHSIISKHFLSFSSFLVKK